MGRYIFVIVSLVAIIALFDWFFHDYLPARRYKREVARRERERNLERLVNERFDKPNTD